MLHTYPQPDRSAVSARARTLALAANAALVGGWLWLYAPVLAYLARTMPGEAFRTNQLVLAGVVVMLALNIRRNQCSLAVGDAPALNWLPLALALGGTIGYVLVERFLDVHLVSALLFGLASYGLVGLWISPAHWRRALPVALLLVGALPLSDYVQIVLGYPMRMLTASLVRDGLATTGVASLGVDTILVFENGISQVDVPCSGVKSLWTGGMFLLAATWIERRPLNGAWLLIAALFGALLFGANLVRVAALVIVGPVAGVPLLAQMLHVPLGVLGFVAVCAVAAVLLRRQPTALIVEDTAPTRRPRWLLPALLASVLVFGALYAPRPQPIASGQALALHFPTPLSVEPLPFTERERQWLTQDGAESLQRVRFHWRGLSGSMIVVASRVRRAHHQPERCYTIYGLAVDQSHTQLVDGAWPVRVLALDKPDDPRRWTATYWFQSADRTVDEYGSRFWADFAAEREPWVLMSILFDDEYDSQATDVQDFYRAVHQTVQMTLTEKVQP